MAVTPFLQRAPCHQKGAPLVNATRREPPWASGATPSHGGTAGCHSLDGTSFCFPRRHLVLLLHCVHTKRHFWQAKKLAGPVKQTQIPATLQSHSLVLAWQDVYANIRALGWGLGLAVMCTSGRNCRWTGSFPMMPCVPASPKQLFKMGIKRAGR